jgi:hypothetical protein
MWRNRNVKIAIVSLGNVSTLQSIMERRQQIKIALVKKSEIDRNWERFEIRTGKLQNTSQAHDALVHFFRSEVLKTPKK